MASLCSSRCLAGRTPASIRRRLTGCPLPIIPRRVAGHTLALIVEDVDRARDVEVNTIAAPEGRVTVGAHHQRHGLAQVLDVDV